MSADSTGRRMGPEVASQSLAEMIAGLSPGDQADIMGHLDARAWSRLLHDWRFWARPSQLPPPGDWLCWLILAGRGFGKTRCGAEWVRMHVEGATPLTAPIRDVFRIAVVGETAADVRDVMIEGESGLLATASPDFRPGFEPSKRRLTWPNGAVATVFSADAPDQLRGPQHHLVWCDELAKWRHGDAVWSNLMFGLRLGDRPRVCVTTTPRPIRLLKEIMAASTTVITRGSTLDNRHNLSAPFLRQVVERYAGTRLGRQELDAEILEDLPGALWTRDILDACRVRRAPALERIVVAVDPPVSSGPASDACGIVIAGRTAGGEAYVIADCSLEGATPLAWARRAVDIYRLHGADRLIAEVNNGGDLVETLVRQIDPDVSYRAVRATRGKVTRAEPVAALYERGVVFHVGALAALEDQLCSFVTGQGWSGPGSPDRADALVWALTELLLKEEPTPRLRSVQ